MSSPFEAALRELESSAGARGGSRVERVDVGKDGTLELLEAATDGRHWWRFEQAGLREHLPAQDRKLALARQCAALHADGYELAAWRPGRRIVLRHDAAPAHLLKGYREVALPAALERARIGSAACERVGVRAPLVEAVLPEWDAYRMSRLPGEPLDLLTAPPDRFFRLGQALREWQEHPAALGTHAHEDEVEVVAAWSRRCELARDALPAPWRSTLDGLRALAARLPRAAPVLCHRDLHEGQILVSGADFGLLDFDLLCRADPCLDPANLIAHLALRTLQEQTPALDLEFDRCVQALLEGLDRETEPGFWPRLRFYESASLLRLALVYSLRPRWSHVTPRLAELARRCLEECDA